MELVAEGIVWVGILAPWVVGAVALEHILERWLPQTWWDKLVGQAGEVDEMNTAPCYQCPERHQGCHGECPRYTAWQQVHSAAREAAAAQRAVDAAITTAVIKRIDRTRKKDRR